MNGESFAVAILSLFGLFIFLRFIHLVEENS